MNNGQSTVAGLILTGGAPPLALGGDLGSLIIANTSSGRMIVINGGVARNSVGVVGRAAGQTGTVTVDGAGSQWINSNDVIVGESGTGTLEIRSGGAVSNLRGHVGFNTGSTGTVIVRDPGSSWTGSGSFFIGNSGIGSLQVRDGGVASTAGNSYLGFSPGASGSAVVSGAGSTWSTAARLVIGGNLAEAGGAGSLRVEDGGVVSATGGVTIRFPGTVRGDGTIIGNVTNEGVVAPGKSTGTLHVTGNFDHFLSATLQIELASPGSFDKLDVTGNINLGGDFFGGTLQVLLIDGFVPHGTQSFDILDWGGSLGGLSFVSVQLPTLGGTLTWDTSQLYTTGVLSVTGMAGDYNDDGNVDAADYVVWRNSLGQGVTLPNDTTPGIVGPEDYTVWRVNFGASAGGSGATTGLPSSANATVPEPATWAFSLSTLCLLALGIGRRRPGRGRLEFTSASALARMNKVASRCTLHVFAAVVLLLFLGLAARPAMGQISFWVAEGVGNWYVPANWSPACPTKAPTRRLTTAVRRDFSILYPAPASCFLALIQATVARWKSSGARPSSTASPWVGWARVR